jgi:hypothetical protein
MSRLIKTLGEPSWPLKCKGVQAFVTRSGGHIAPIRFRLGSRVVAPMHVAPWHGEKLGRNTPPIIRALRGDFFCMPFGANASAFGREAHPVHGETANADWRMVSATTVKGCSELKLNLKTRVRKGSVDKTIRLVDGHTAVYQRHTIRGMAGPMCPGHHAMLKFPSSGGLISVSKFVLGRTFVKPLESPDALGYSVLKPDAEFHSLDAVPTITGAATDLSRFPARRGYEDLVMMVGDPSLPFGWTAVVFPEQRFVWFALKDVRTLRNTIFWISNGGRHYAPWSSRHVDVMGLEETTSFFHLGMKESAEPNAISKMGHPTALQLDPKSPTTVNYIFGVAEVPADFGRVSSIERVAGGVEIRGRGNSVRASIDMDFLFGFD